MEASLKGEWIRAERTVTTEDGNYLIGKAVENEVNESDSASLNVIGDDLSFEGKVPESQIPSVIEKMISEPPDGSAEQEDSLPAEFFEQLSARQRILIKILLEHDGRVTGPDIRDEMRTQYDQEVSHSGSGTAGIISGITRKYGKEFRNDLIQGTVSHHNDEGSRVYEFWIGEKYEEELRDQFNGDVGSNDDDGSGNRSYKIINPDKVEPGQKVKYILKTVHQDMTSAPYEGTLTISEVVKEGDTEDDPIILYFEYGKDEYGVSTRRAVYDHKSDKDPEYQKARMSDGDVEYWRKFGTEGGLDLFSLEGRTL